MSKKGKAKKTERVAVPDTEGLSQTVLAKILGLVRQQIYDFTSQGCPKNTDGTYSLRLFFQWYKDRIKKTDNALEDEQVRRTKAQATLAEIKIAEAQDRLVDRLAMLRVIGEHITTASRRLQDIPHLLARLVPQDLRKDFIEDATQEIYGILTELADGEWDKQAKKIEATEDDEDEETEDQVEGTPSKTPGARRS